MKTPPLNLLNLVGASKGLWTCISVVYAVTGYRTKTQRWMLHCRCYCGKERNLYQHQWKGQGVTSRSCGCARGQHISEAKASPA